MKEENEKLKAENAELKEKLIDTEKLIDKVKEESRLEKEHALVSQEAELTKKYLVELSEIQKRFGI